MSLVKACSLGLSSYLWAGYAIDFLESQTT